MTRARRALRLLAETVREIGILPVVFAPLESAFADRPIDLRLLMLLIGLSLGFIPCGILIESKD